MMLIFPCSNSLDKTLNCSITNFAWGCVNSMDWSARMEPWNTGVVCSGVSKLNIYDVNVITMLQMRFTEPSNQDICRLN